MTTPTQGTRADEILARLDAVESRLQRSFIVGSGGHYIALPGMASDGIEAFYEAYRLTKDALAELSRLTEDNAALRARVEEAEREFFQLRRWASDASLALGGQPKASDVGRGRTNVERILKRLLKITNEAPRPPRSHVPASAPARSEPTRKPVVFGVVGEPFGADHLVRGQADATVCGQRIDKDWFTARGLWTADALPSELCSLCRASAPSVVTASSEPTESPASTEETNNG